MQQIALQEPAQLADSALSERTVLIFKHSTRCSISMMAWSRLQRHWNQRVEHIPVFYLDLLNFRPVSAEIAEKFNVPHESPQALLIRNGRCVWHASHNAISVEALEEALEIS
ncbi:MAG: bacillithiol system redox-active protein YtxJ [Bacteroidia bacterium]|nr:bacillithiol system redox-active protein YtxJ [Bacteroidia bacterium]